jgi:hypothetical protein
VRLAVHHELAAVWPIDPAQDLSERRLPGAILSDDGVRFTRHDIEVNAVENAVADERFANPHRTEQRPEAFADFSRLFSHDSESVLLLAGVGGWLKVAPAAPDPLVSVRLNNRRAIRKDELFTGKLVGLLAWDVLAHEL